MTLQRIAETLRAVDPRVVHSPRVPTETEMAQWRATCRAFVYGAEATGPIGRVAFLRECGYTFDAGGAGHDR